MSNEESSIVQFLKNLLLSHKQSISGLAADLGVSHSTVSRWISAKYKPDTRSCLRLAEYSGIPLEKILNATGQLPKKTDIEPLRWPEFREYAEKRYPDMLSEDIITMVEGLIKSKKNGKHKRQRT